jgi:CheY-like chemotaxis protein
VPILIAGRKLLLADDSIAIQKVIDLTFTDEGMEVTTVGDGHDALEKLNQSKPDVVLADVYMPGVDGYELCKFIKQNDRFSGVPVMLLIGTFEPFDEAEAKRAGADDIVTKPFQSIRQLVSRVGSLLSHAPAEKVESTPEYSTPGVVESESRATEKEESASDYSMPGLVEYGSTAAKPEISEPPEQSNVRVFVEAPLMSESETEASTADEHHCPPNIELQTADTRKLEPIDEVPVALAADDTLEMEAVAVSKVREIPFEEVASQYDQHMSYQPAQNQVGQGFEDSVLDLGEVDNFAPAESEDDFVLDLDVGTESGARVWDPAAAPSYAGPAFAAAPAVHEPILTMSTEPASADSQEWTIVTPVVAPTTNWEVRTDESSESEAVHATANQLSPEVIEAISRRVVEHLSDKVVREIAWEVVPELSEILIKKRLEEQK